MSKQVERDNTSTDLFEHPDQWPESVKQVLAQHPDDGLEYAECKALQADLEQIGYTVSFELDGVPYGLRPLA